MKMADLTFGVNSQAWAVAVLLAQEEVEFENDEVKLRYSIATSPWYNGRERGFCFQFGNWLGPILNIAVFEHRNSDALCALRWETKSLDMNPPTIDRDGKLAYPTDSKYNDIAHQEAYREVGKMVEWIKEEFEKFIPVSQNYSDKTNV